MVKPLHLVALLFKRATLYPPAATDARKMGVSLLAPSPPSPILSVIMEDRAAEGAQINTLTQPRQTPVTFPGHFILGQDAEPARTGLKGREPNLVLD